MKTFKEYMEGRWSTPETSARSDYMARQRSNLDQEKLGTGIFDMEFVNAIEHMPLEQAQQMALDIIDNDTSATAANIENARRKVLSARSILELMKMISDAILKYGGNGVIALGR